MKNYLDVRPQVRALWAGLITIIIAVALLLAVNYGFSYFGLDNEINFSWLVIDIMYLSVIIWFIDKIYSYIWYKRTDYFIDEYGIHSHTKIIGEHSDTVPFRNIVSYAKTKSKTHRILGLTDIDIQDAGDDYPGTFFQDLNDADADKVYELLHENVKHVKIADGIKK